MHSVLKRGLVTIAAGVICLLAIGATGGVGPCGGLLGYGALIVCAVGFGMTVIGLRRILSKSPDVKTESGLVEYNEEELRDFRSPHHP